MSALTVSFASECLIRDLFSNPAFGPAAIAHRALHHGGHNGRVAICSTAESGGYISASSSVVSVAGSDRSVAAAASGRTARLNAKLEKLQRDNERLRQATGSPTKTRGPSPLGVQLQAPEPCSRDPCSRDPCSQDSCSRQAGNPFQQQGCITAPMMS